MDASRCYKKAAEASPKDNQICSACSISMSCLSEMLDYTLAVIKQEKTSQMEEKLKNGRKNWHIVRKMCIKSKERGNFYRISL